MSRDKSDYVRFELRFEKEFSDRVDAWIKDEKNGAPKAVVVREALELLMNIGNRDSAVLSQRNLALIDRVRAMAPSAPRRGDVVEDALKEYLEKYNVP